MAKQRTSESEKSPKDTHRYGIGEWYGKSFPQLTPDERRTFAEIALKHSSGEDKSFVPSQCPFQRSTGMDKACSKKGGVCSIRQYTRRGETRLVEPSGTLRTTCPFRFLQDATIFAWVGEVVLRTSNPLVLTQIGFLERPKRRSPDGQLSGFEEAGRIDHVLVHPTRKPLEWCALETQAVYFSGKKMESDFRAIRAHAGDSLPFPASHRRPDYRSSGPKRLMPQLLLKVEQLRRWDKRMAVVIDRDFFQNIGSMEEVLGHDLSSADIAWFVVEFDAGQQDALLKRGSVHLTTLEKAREGLGSGHPVPKEVFEARLREKIARKYPEAAASLGFSQ